MPDAANLIFLPWVRQGAAAAIQTTDSLGPAQPAAVQVAITLALNGSALQPSTMVQLRGPADIVGIDANQVVRTEPRAGSTDFESNFFPSIEFDRPDFPWLFTPVAATAEGRLRPWLCLVVLRQQDGVQLASPPGSPLPVLSIAAPAEPAAELPDLRESWGWAHAQAALDGDLAATLDGSPELSLSRLVCPRLLAAETGYLACVVPTFELGRRAGLGLPIAEADLVAAGALAPAWSLAEAPAALQLPVYYSWSFTTGPGGDFKSLASRLTHDAPAGLGLRPVDILHPGFTWPSGVPDEPPATLTLQLEGALQPIADDTPAVLWSDPPAPAFETALAKIVNRPALAPSDEPLLAPPLYGRWYAGRDVATPAAANWFDELNLDPRWRVAAALGTRVVQQHQEALMASAWEQAAQMQQANQRLRRLQLSMAVGESLHARHLATLVTPQTTERMLRIAAPALSRIRMKAVSVVSPVSPVTSARSARSASAVNVGRRPTDAPTGPPTRPPIDPPSEPPTRPPIHLPPSPPPVTPPATLPTTPPITSPADSPPGRTLYAQMMGSTLPVPAVRAAMRRVGRQRGPLTRRIAAQGYARNPVFTWVARLDDGDMGVPSTAPPAADYATLPPLPSVDVVTAALWNRGFQVAPENQPIPPLPAVDLLPAAWDYPGFFRAAAAEHLARLRGPQAIPITVHLTLEQAAELVLEQMHPRVALANLARAVVSTGDNVLPPTAAGIAPLGTETVMMAPIFPQPMVEPLKEISQSLLLPGLDAVKPETVLGLRTNRAFVEAYMLGLNVEMGCEMLWRGFPTDQQGTPFRNFWGQDASANASPDIDDLRLRLDRTLGQAPPTAPADEFVLLVRSALLRRYPNALIYLTPAPLGDASASEVLPIFNGAMEPDVAFFGFPLSSATATGSDGGAGYYVVFQEHPTEPRFGIDDGTQPPGLAYLPIGSQQPAGIPPNTAYTWGRNAAQIAGLARRQPVRVAIRAARLLATT